MKTKRQFLFWVSMMVLLPLAACGQFSSESTPSIIALTQTPYPTYTPQPTYTPYPTYTPDTLYTPYPTYTPFVPSVPTTITIEQLQKSFAIYFPGNYALSKRDETYRAGSLVSYDFVQVGEFIKSDDPYFTSQPPYFYEIQFHTLESIKSFYDWCDQQALHEVPCFLNGDPDLLGRYYGQKEAFSSIKDYESYKIQKIGERYYFVKTEGCGGGYCALRGYTTFLRDSDVDVKVVVYILLHPDNSEQQEELSDRLFTSFYVELLP